MIFTGSWGHGMLCMHSTIMEYIHLQTVLYLHMYNTHTITLLYIPMPVLALLVCGY